MNTLIELNNVVSMTTLEIAELTGKRHDNVLRDVRNMLTELYGSGGLLKFGDTYKNEQNGETYVMFRLDKKHTLILVTGYSVKLRASIIEHIEFLESQVKRLEDRHKRVAIQSANRRGVTWGDYCKTVGLPAQKLLKAIRKYGQLLRFRPDGRVEVHPVYKDYFTLIKPTDRRFSSSGLNFRFNAKGIERFSADKAVERFREILIEQLGSDYEKQMLLVSKAKTQGGDICVS
ncbi:MULTISPECIES: Rha family transcriptional regulator [Enterobacterales]|uniref:Rha family transcriptional regulator n=1 Tax=Enterobacterales TaxID=91347 RepID=UPI0001B0BFAD|nr:MULTISPECIES: Rha family transcriptional regulator [Enterobacterales]ACX86688.1 Phage regulatory protein, Rha-like protein [Pectobacterium parmentieri WPP163]CAI0758791.1 Uncharacterized phage-encoded protein [Serratia liquefaciens]HDS5481497.1 Rha family transcriptional regulator [Serratia liquefaciens]HEJ7948415.1 Rha family transcriptional regulator [Serratia liquefaciens]